MTAGSLDLGRLLATVDIIDAPFQRKYTRIISQFQKLGGEAASSSAGTTKLDESLVGIGTSAERTAVGLGRVTRATTETSAAQQRAAAVAARHAEATSTVGKVMERTAGLTAQERQAVLSLTAAQDRLNAVQVGGAASTRQLASAQAGLIGAQRRVAAAEEQSAASSSRWRMSLAGTAKMAGEMGLLVGGFEVIKKAIDITKEANDFARSMVQVQTNADVTKAEVNKASGALLAMAGPVAAAPDKLAVAWYHAKSVGLAYAKSIETTRIAAEGARVGHADLEETMNALTSTVASNIPGVKNMSSAMGQLIAIVGSGDMKLADLNQALGSGILSVVKGYGLSLTDVGAALATFGDNNIRGAEAATMLRMSVQAMAVPVKAGYGELKLLGLTANTLRDDMQQGGLNKAILDLKAHLDKAGVGAKEVGGILTEVFGKRAGPGIAVLIGQTDRLESKFQILRDSGANFGSKWDATTQTASFALSSLGHRAEAAGIVLTQKLGPSIASVARGLSVALPVGIGVASEALRPFEMAWTGLGAVLGPVAGWVGDIGHVLSPIGPELRITAGAALALWAGFKAGQLVGVGLTAIKSGLDTLALRAMYAGDAVSAGFARIGTAASAAAVETGAASATIAGEADAASASVVASGEAAEIGWAGLAGPLGAAAIGVFAIASMFHRSSSASKEATDAAKAYADVLSSGGKSGLVDSITSQLAKNNVPQKINELNKALGSVQYSGKEFSTAIQMQGKPLADLRARLQAVVDAGRLYEADNGVRTKSYIQATKLLKDLNAQVTGLSKATIKDLIDTKAFAGVSASIDKVSVASKVGSDTAKQYAQMLGIAVDKNGVAAVSSRVLEAAVSTVSKAYESATQTGNDFLGALNSFSTSAGTAADRASMIGAILKANAGDGLNFASVMNGAATSVHQLGVDTRSAASQVGKSGISTRAYLRSLVDLKTGAISFSKVAAGPLISDLQGIQSSAIAAAVATYQHNRAFEGGKRAADDAVKGYAGVERSLESQFVKLGMTRAQAQRLTEKYLGVPKKVRTLIEQAGADPVVSVLNRIGQQLAYLSGHPWNAKVGATDNASATIGRIAGELSNINGSTANVYVAYTPTGTHKLMANGGLMDFYANGGTREQHVAQIAPAGAMRVWAEPETGGEAYIPLAASKRLRSRAIASETVQRLGGIAMFANGGAMKGYANGSSAIKLPGTPVQYGRPAVASSAVVMQNQPVRPIYLTIALDGRVLKEVVVQPEIERAVIELSNQIHYGRY